MVAGQFPTTRLIGDYDPTGDTIIREMLEDSAFNLTRIEKATRLCVIVGVVLLLILLLR